MCGIVGAIMPGGVRRFLLRGLAALEYRGYDSAGVAFADDKRIRRLAVAGRVGKLRRRVPSAAGSVGIGHTRWATHGAPTEQNAHPVMAGSVAIVHNGIIENHAALRAELTAGGRVFSTDTDSEVIAHLLELALIAEKDFLAAMQKTEARLEGAFAIAAVAAGRAEIVFARRGSPLMVGVGEEGVFVASDAQAMERAARIAYLADGDCGLLNAGGARIADAKGKTAKREWRSLPTGMAVAALGEHRHFMQKEIFEQPFAVASAMQPFIDDKQIVMRHFGRGAAAMLRRVKSVLIVACGTSYHAGMVARYWLQGFGIPCRVEIASEYRYCGDAQAAESLAVAVSQSGETADTLSAMRAAKAAGATTLALANVPLSAMVEEADFVMPTGAGPEIGVASTKCFTAQLVQLLLLSLAAAKARGVLPPPQERAALAQLRRLPQLMRRALLIEEDIRRWARSFAAATSALFIGRHAHYPLALEGALKLKEISYVHAEGCAAGELKHGMLALIDDKIPVVGLAPANALAAKTESNLSAVAARNGRLFILAGGTIKLPGAQVLQLDDGGEWVSPMVYAVPLQLLAYHTALQKGTDIDKPRNLAKSVTVE